MCFKQRRTPARVITFASILVILGGIAMVIETIYFYLGQSILNADFGGLSESIKQWKLIIFAILIVFSSLAIVVGITGTTCLCKPCNNHCCWAVMFGISLTLVWIITLVIGAVLTGVAAMGPKTLTTFCSGNGTGSTQLQFILDQVTVIDSSINGYSGKFMCSALCPCPPSVSGPWWNLPEATLNTWNRTKTPAISSTDVIINSKGQYRLVNSTATQKPYTKFTECNSTLAALPNSPVPKDPQIATGLKILSYFENKYSCSGICSPGLFFYSLDLNAGLPSQKCLTQLNNEIGSSITYLGITGLVTGALMFFIWIFQYCLWRSQWQELHPYQN